MTFFYPLAPPPAPSSTFLPTADLGGQAASLTLRNFLGFGLVQPLIRDRKSDFLAKGGVELVQSCVAQILGTSCSSPDGSIAGELPWNPLFGSRLYLLKHRKGQVLQELGRLYVIEPLTRFEPRVVVTDTQFSFSQNERSFTIFLRYDIIDRNVPGNQVIVADVEQNVELGGG